MKVMGYRRQWKETDLLFDVQEEEDSRPSKESLNSANLSEGLKSGKLFAIRGMLNGRDKKLFIA